jgi:GrpB-like predicted nucleotidyltransferase (UPF0157 family)
VFPVGSAAQQFAGADAGNQRAFRLRRQRRRTPQALGRHRMAIMSQVRALGLRRGEVVVTPYDPRWPELFVESADEIRRAIGTSILGVHHVGSTSVPGLCAKPILDILVSVSDLEVALSLEPALRAIGYEFRPDEAIRDRRFFRRPCGGACRTHHLSLAEPNSRHHTATLAFRDILRDQPHLAAEYAHLKLSLAKRFSRNRPAYIDAKTEFVTRVLASHGVS